MKVADLKKCLEIANPSYDVCIRLKPQGFPKHKAYLSQDINMFFDKGRLIINGIIDIKEPQVDKEE